MAKNTENKEEVKVVVTADVKPETITEVEVKPEATTEVEVKPELTFEEIVKAEREATVKVYEDKIAAATKAKNKPLAQRYANHLAQLKKQLEKN